MVNKNPKPTTFDNVFRTMAQKMPWMMVALINEVFGETYPGDIKITRLRNEFMTEGGKIITDSIYLIGEKYYHIECQSTPDKMMEIRMIEYDFMIAHEHAEKKNGQYMIRFPESAVLYLRHNSKTPDRLKVTVEMPGGKSAEYYAKVIKAQDYTKDEIFRKKLLILVPFYLMRYENQFDEMDVSEELRNDFLKECGELRLRIEKETGDKETLYADLMGLILKVSDHILKKHGKTKKGVKDIMGGRVLELESERLLKKGRIEGSNAAISKLAAHYMSENPKLTQAEAVKMAEKILKA